MVATALRTRVLLQYDSAIEAHRERARERDPCRQARGTSHSCRTSRKRGRTCTRARTQCDPP